MITYRLDALVVSAVPLMLILLLLYLLSGIQFCISHFRAIKDPGRPYRGGPVGLALLLFAWGERL